MADAQDDSIYMNKRTTISYLSSWMSSRPNENQLFEKGVLVGAPASSVAQNNTQDGFRASVFRVLKGSVSGIQAQPQPKEETIFGRSLEWLHEQSTMPVPMIVLQAIGYLGRRTDLEGIFRISTSHGHLMELKKLFKTPTDAVVFESHTNDPHAVASLLKLFLRELPISIIIPTVYRQLISLYKSGATNTDHDTLQKYSNALLELPPCHLQTAAMLFRFFEEVASKSDQNLMNASNLGVPLGPCLMRTDDNNPAFQIECWDSKITQFLLENQDQIFTPLMEKHEQRLEEQINKRRLSQMAECIPAPLSIKRGLASSSSNSDNLAGLANGLSPRSATVSILPSFVPPSATSPAPASAGYFANKRPDTDGFEFRVLGVEVGLLDKRLENYFYIKFTTAGESICIHRRYEDIATLDQGLRETYGPKGIVELPRRALVFRDDQALVPQLEQYLNFLNHLNQVYFLRYFKEFVTQREGVDDDDSFVVWSICVHNPNGEFLGHLKCNGSDMEVVKDFERTPNFLWTIHRTKVRRPGTNEEITCCGARSVSAQMFMYRSRLLSYAKLDSTFTERTSIDMSSSVWNIYKGTYAESSPFYVSNKFLMISSGSCDQPVQFLIHKVYNSTVEIPK